MIGNNNINVSILIRTKNEEEHLGKVLDALVSQSYKSFEIIIVDSGSTDRTLEIARRYPVKIYEIKPEDFTFGYSLNYGFQMAKGKYVVCLSAHALPLSRDWLEILISNFSDDKVAAVMCKVLPWPDCNPFDKRGLLKKYNVSKQPITGNPPFFFSNANSAIRKSIWGKIKFNEKLPAVEDQDWIQKVRKQNYIIIYEPSVQVYHSHNETLKQIFRRYYREPYALKLLKLKEYSLAEIFFDLVAGTVYDMLYVLFKGKNLKWFFFAPLRRFAMNLARFKARGSQ